MFLHIGWPNHSSTRARHDGECSLFSGFEQAPVLGLKHSTCRRKGVRSGFLTTEYGPEPLGNTAAVDVHCDSGSAKVVKKRGADLEENYTARGGNGTLEIGTY